MRTMYDSTNASAIPKTAKMVAGYIDGTSFKWTAEDWARFPKETVRVRIARRTHTNDGHVLDVEQGIPTVWPINESIVDWVLMRRKAGVEPTIYCNQLNDWDSLKRLFGNAGVRPPFWWVARYDNKKAIPAGAIAKQYADPPVHGKGHFDLSSVADYWPGVDKEEDGMTPEQWTKLTEKLARLEAIETENQRRIGLTRADIANMAGTLSDNDAALLAAVQGDKDNPVDVEALADALAMRIPAANVEALLDALRARLEN